MGLYHNRIVVKVGTSTLTNEIRQNNLKAFDCIARRNRRRHKQIADKTTPYEYADKAGCRRRTMQYHVSV